MLETPGGQPTATATMEYVAVSTTEEGKQRVYYNEEELEACGCAGRVTAEEHARITERMKKRANEPRPRFSVVFGAVVFCLFFLGVYAMCVDLPEIILISGNYQDIRYLNHTTKTMHKEVKLHDAEITDIQDFLVAEYFDPCVDSKCRSQRLLDMFGGELPAKYQHYLLEQGGRAK